MERSFKISVSCYSDKRFQNYTLEVKNTYRIDKVKRQIETEFGIPVIHQRLIYSGKQLSNHNTLEYYGITWDSTLSLILPASYGKKTRSNPRPKISVRDDDEDDDSFRIQGSDQKPETSDDRLSYENEVEDAVDEDEDDDNLNTHFDNDLDIIDPESYYGVWDQLATYISERSEFHRCEGRYRQHDNETWMDLKMRQDEYSGIPSTVWTAFLKSTTTPSWPPDADYQLQSRIRDSLKKTILILSRCSHNIKILQGKKFCGNTFNFLRGHHSSNVAELVPIFVRDIYNLRLRLVRAFEIWNHDATNSPAKLLKTIYAEVLQPCFLILECICGDTGDIGELIVGQDISLDLALSLLRSIALFLDLALLSYSGSHGLNLSPVDIKRTKRSFNVQWEGIPFGFQCSLARLACLHGFLDEREVWVFHTFQAKRNTSQPWNFVFTSPISILTTMKQFADIWGPVYAVPDGTSPSRYKQYNVSKGIICQARGKPHPEFPTAVRCHWYSEMTWKMAFRNPFKSMVLRLARPASLSQHATLLIGIGMADNPTCEYSPNQYEKDYGNLLGELGTKESDWRWEARGASVGFTNFLTVSMFGIQKRIPETPLKQRILDKWRSEPSTRNPKILNHLLGVEISHCTGNARRIALKRLLTLPAIKSSLAQQFPRWHMTTWGIALNRTLETEDNNGENITQFWIDHLEHRSHIAQMVCYVLDLLGPTGLDDQWLNLGAAVLVNGDERKITLEIKKNTWVVLLKDTPSTAAFCIINGSCLVCRLPDLSHSAMNCHRRGIGPEQALTVLQSHIAIDTGKRWAKVLVRSVNESFKKITMGQSSTVILAWDRNRSVFSRRSLALQRPVEGIEVKNPASSWGKQTEIYIQASSLSWGGLSTARWTGSDVEDAMEHDVEDAMELDENDRNEVVSISQQQQNTTRGWRRIEGFGLLGQRNRAELNIDPRPRLQTLPEAAQIVEGPRRQLGG